MTILAGVFSRNPSVRIPDSVCDTLKKNISRDPSDHPIEFRDAQAYFVKVDIGAFDRPAHRVAPTGSMAILAGEPLLTRDGPTGPGRDVHLAYLQTQWDERDFRSLRSASGTYCAAYFDPRTCTGHLVADRLGLRTLYYCVVDDFVYFATALRILEAIPQVPKVLDVFALRGFDHSARRCQINPVFSLGCHCTRAGHRRRSDGRNLPAVPVGSAPTVAR